MGLRAILLFISLEGVLFQLQLGDDNALWLAYFEGQVKDLLLADQTDDPLLAVLVG